MFGRGWLTLLAKRRFEADAQMRQCAPLLRPAYGAALILHLLHTEAPNIDFGKLLSLSQQLRASQDEGLAQFWHGSLGLNRWADAKLFQNNRFSTPQQT